MSRTHHGRPEYRLALDYPHISVSRVDARAEVAPARRYEFGSATLLADLRRLGSEIKAAGARLTVVLPEGEVWRGRLALDGARLHNRGRTARSRAAEAMGLPAAALAVRLGRLGRDGTRAAAAVRRETLAETRGFLARAGLRPTRITGAGEFEGFAEAPGFDAAPLREALRPALPALGGLVAAAALFALLLHPDATPPDAGLIGPAPLAAVESSERPAPAVAEIAPRARPADLVRVVAVPDREPATPRGAPGAPRVPSADAGLSFQPPVTMASRNMPVADLPPVPTADSALRLSELSVARARIAETLMSLPLLRAATAPPAAVPAPVAAPATMEPAVGVAEDAAATPAPSALRPVTTAPRPQRRPVAAVVVPVPEATEVAVVEPAPAAAPEATPAAASVSPGLAAVAAPPPRPRGAGSEQVAQAVGAAIVVASLGPPAGVVQDAGPSLAAAIASASRPEPRRAAPVPVRQAARQPTRQPTRHAAAPAASRPAATPRSATQAPQRQVAAVQPARQATRRQVAAVQPARQAPQRVVTVPARQAAPAATARPAAQTQTRAATQPARQQPRRAAAAARPANSNATSSATAAAAATESAALSRRSLALIGVFGPERDRYAMVRLPNGRMQRVRAGDQVQGARVAGIGASSVQLASGGRTTVLAMP